LSSALELSVSVSEGGLKTSSHVEQMDVIVEEGGGEDEAEEGEEDEEDDNDEERPRLKEEGEEGEEGGEEEGVTPAHHKINHLLHEVLPLCYHKERSDAFAVQFSQVVKHKRAQKVREGEREGRRGGGMSQQRRSDFSTTLPPLPSSLPPSHSVSSPSSSAFLGKAWSSSLSTAASLRPSPPSSLT